MPCNLQRPARWCLDRETVMHTPGTSEFLPSPVSRVPGYPGCTVPVLAVDTLWHRNLSRVSEFLHV
eukprot:1533588-Rhodomonas_salina.1